MAAAHGEPHPEPHVECSGVRLGAPDGGGGALRDLSFALERGALRPLLGPAGAGKSALLRVIAGLERPDAGRVRVGGRDLAAASGAGLRALRRGAVGLAGAAPPAPRRSAAANVALPLRIAGVPAARARRRAGELLDLLGLGGQADAPAGRLPPAAAVRAAVGAALAHGPPLLLLDEPAAALGGEERGELAALLRRLHGELGLTLLAATRDADFARLLGGEARMRAGRVVSERVRLSAYARGGGERVEELAVIDGEGRVAIPREARAALGIGRRARLSVEDGRLAIRPERPPPDARPPWRR